MTLEEFQKFIDDQDALFRSLGKSSSERERVLARAVKLSEEMGELSGEVLGFLGLQRKSKLEGKSLESVADEVADVVIVAFLLAKSMDVDVPTALARKIKKIQEKHNKELLANAGGEGGAL